MKKVSGFCYILFRALFTAAVWITAVAGAVLCIGEVLFLTELLIGLKLYAFVLKVLQLVGPLALVFAVGMFGCRYLEDHLAQRKPVYIGVAELGAEIAAWLLKYDLCFMGVQVIRRLLMMLQASYVRKDFAGDPVGFVGYLLSDAWLYLILAVVLVLLQVFCKRLQRKKKRA